MHLAPFCSSLVRMTKAIRVPAWMADAGRARVCASTKARKGRKSFRRLFRIVILRSQLPINSATARTTQPKFLAHFPHHYSTGFEALVWTLLWTNIDWQGGPHMTWEGPHPPDASRYATWRWQGTIRVILKDKPRPCSKLKQQPKSLQEASNTLSD